MPVWLYFLFATLLFLGNCLGWCLTLVSLPGNWLIVALSLLFTLLVTTNSGLGLSWPVMAALLVLAIAGEVIEMVAGAAGAARLGASRRSVALSLAGAIVGSFVGMAVGLPIVIVGSAMAGLGGGALGAFVGAMLGEHWKGRSLEQGVQVGTAAFLGRLLGTAGKLIVATIMTVVVTLDSFVW